MAVNSAKINEFVMAHSFDCKCTILLCLVIFLNKAHLAINARLTGNILGHSQLDLVFGGAQDACGFVVAHTNCTLTSQLKNLVTNLQNQ